MRLKSIVPLLIAWLVLFCIAGIAIGFIIDVPDLLRLQGNYGEVPGSVARLIPESHGLVEVTYIVKGVMYTRSVMPHLEDHAIAEGDSVQVYYSPSTPAVAVIAPPSEILAEQIPSWIAGSLLISIVLIISIGSLWKSTPRGVSAFVISPKIISSGVAIGAIGGLIVSIYGGTLNGAKLGGAAFVLGGCTLFLILAWQKQLSWREIFHSKEFLIATALVVLGNVINVVL